MYEQLPSFVREPDPAVYLSDNYVILDFETTNREYGTALDGQNQLLLAAWSLGPAHGRYSGEMRSHWGSEFEQGELIRDIESAAFIVAHNTKFELAWLKRCGADLRRILPYDTMIGEKVLAGNRKVPLSLDATAKRRGLGNKASTVAAFIKAGVCPSNIPKGLLQSYCEQDVSLTEKIFLAQREELQGLGLLPVAYCRNLVTPVLADIEFNGMTLDPNRVLTTYEDYSQRYEQLALEFAKITGGINPKSGKQMREHVYGKLGFAETTDHRGNAVKTDGGAAKVDKATLSSLVAVTDEQKEFKRLAVELSKLKVPLQNVKKMMKICEENPDDTRVYGTFNQTVTATDRLSSTGRKGGFNFQNFDRAHKPLFQARDSGRVICEVDGAQLEFRVAAYLGNDANAKSDISQGVDVHAATAAVIGCDRQTAKAFTFKPMFGGASGTPKQKRYFAYFKQRYSGIARIQDKWAMDAASRKFTVAPWGLRSYWPDAEVHHGGYVKGQTQIYNLFIQSLATADIIPLCLVLLWHYIEDMPCCMLVNTIHDSIIADVELDSLEAYKKIAARVFTSDIYTVLSSLYGMQFDVPLGAGIKSATHWGEGKEEKHEPEAL